jgi:hypothetical protein
MVGATRLELATSRPPAVRATNCATPRDVYEYNYILFTAGGLAVTFRDPATS